jgi:hypothetical protein
MADITAIVSAGEKLGYKGEELREFVKHQEQQYQKQQDEAKEARDEAREIRAFEREKLKSREQDRVVELEKIKLEQGSREQDRVVQLEKIKLEHERLKIESKQAEREGRKALGKVKIPPFNEKEDNFDSYISRFESVAKLRGWGNEEWSVQLSLLLTGKALDTFYGLSEEEQQDYNVVKEALLRKYDLTEEVSEAISHDPSRAKRKRTTVHGEVRKTF